MAKFSGAKVIELSKKDFDNSFKIKSGKSGMVVFYAPWCHFCQMLVPEYKKLSMKSGIKVYAINVDENQEVTSNFGVQGFPTIKYVNKLGEIDGETYYGERDAESMMKFIKEKSMSFLFSKVHI